MFHTTWWSAPELLSCLMDTLHIFLTHNTGILMSLYCILYKFNAHESISVITMHVIQMSSHFCDLNCNCLFTEAWHLEFYSQWSWATTAAGLKKDKACNLSRFPEVSASSPKRIKTTLRNLAGKSAQMASHNFDGVTHGFLVLNFFYPLQMMS